MTALLGLLMQRAADSAGDCPDDAVRVQRDKRPLVDGRNRY
jgi:hypothetical protein